MGNLIAAAGAVAVTFATEAIKKRITHDISITGGPEVGKTTLDSYLKTPSVEVPPINERTKAVGSPQKRRVVWENKLGSTISRTVRTQDLPGQNRVEFRIGWLETILKRQSELILHIIDHRHIIKQGSRENQEAFAFITEFLCDQRIPDSMNLTRKQKRILKKKNYKPVVILVASKWDIWEGLIHTSDRRRFQDGTIYKPVYCYKCQTIDSIKCKCGKENLSFHPIFAPFRKQLWKLQEHGISTMLAIISARDGTGVEELFKRAFKLLQR